jgi:acetyl esterase/lipase
VDYGQTSFLLKHARDFAGGVPLDDARVSPINAELAGLAPLFVVAGSAERLFDECAELVALAQRAGVAAELCVAEDMPHNPPAMAGFHANAANAFEKCAQFVAEQLSR